MKMNGKEKLVGQQTKLLRRGRRGRVGVVEGIMGKANYIMEGKNIIMDKKKKG